MEIFYKLSVPNFTHDPKYQRTFERADNGTAEPWTQARADSERTAKQRS